MLCLQDLSEFRLLMIKCNVEIMDVEDGYSVYSCLGTEALASFKISVYVRAFINDVAMRAICHFVIRLTECDKKKFIS